MPALHQPRATHKPAAKSAGGGMRAFGNDFPANGCDPAVEAPDL